MASTSPRPLLWTRKGYPISDFGLYINETNSLAGTYRFIGEFDNATSAPTLGIALFNGAITNVAWNQATHILTANVTNNDAGGVIILTLKNTGGTTQQLHFIQPGYPTTNWPIYANPWLTHLTTNNPTVLRFMDFHNTNNKRRNQLVGTLHADFYDPKYAPEPDRPALRRHL